LEAAQAQGECTVTKVEDVDVVVFDLDGMALHTNNFTLNVHLADDEQDSIVREWVEGWCSENGRAVKDVDWAYGYEL